VTPGRARWLLWGVLLAGAAWLAVFGDKAPARGEIALPTRVAAVEAPRAAPASEPVVSLLPRAPSTSDGLDRPDAGNPFAPRQWHAPPPAPAPIAAVPAPAAPPLPYAFLGKKQEGGAWEVYLARGDQSFVVREGQTLEGQYRVGRIAPPQLELTYLPLGLPQTLAIGEAL
jgi:hypothetical protein